MALNMNMHPEHVLPGLFDFGCAQDELCDLAGPFDLADLLTPPGSRCTSPLLPKASFAPAFQPIFERPHDCHDGLDFDSFSFDDLTRTLSRAHTPTPDVLTPPPSPEHAASAAVLADPVFHEVMSMLSDPQDSYAESYESEDEVHADSKPATPASNKSGRAQRKRKSYAAMLDDSYDEEEQRSSSASQRVAKRPRATATKTKQQAPPASPAMLSPPSSPTSLSGLSKRDSHNISERQRRKDLKRSFDALRDVLSLDDRTHTARILQAAIEEIEALQAEEKRLMAEMRRFK